MPDQPRPTSTERHPDIQGQSPAGMTLRFLPPKTGRLLAIVVTTLIGLLLFGLALPASPFVRAGGSPDGGTPVASPVAVEAPADSTWVTYGPCDVAPREFDGTMAVIAGAFLDPEPPSFSLGFEPEVRESPGGPVTSYRLPDGPVPPASSVEAVVQLLGAGTNCGSSLQALAYLTDDYLIRRALDDEFGSSFIASLWRSAHAVETPAPSFPAPITDGNGSEIQAPLPPQNRTPPERTGTRAYQLYGFRMVDDTHLGAYVEIANNVSAENFEPIEPTFEQTGYVVFALQPDGTWLIDAYESPYTILQQRLFPDDGATPMA